MARNKKNSKRQRRKRKLILFIIEIIILILVAGALFVYSKLDPTKFRVADIYIRRPDRRRAYLGAPSGARHRTRAHPRHGRAPRV